MVSSNNQNIKKFNFIKYWIVEKKHCSCTNTGCYKFDALVLLSQKL